MSGRGAEHIMTALLLDTGIYTVSEAAVLLNTASQRVRGWISGYPRTKGAPIISNEVGWLDGQLAMAFVNLMEVRFIDYFAKRGVHVSSIRAMAKEAKEFLNHPHPFATNTIFKTDGKEIFAEVADKTGDPKLYALKKRNWAMYEVMAASLQNDVVYTPEGDPELFVPRAKIAPEVIIHPKISFGQPVLRASGVPTKTIMNAFLAEGKDIDAVSDWYELPADHVRQAIKFEQDIAKAS